MTGSIPTEALRVLDYINHSVEGVSQSDLTRANLATPSALSRALNGLSAQGLIERDEVTRLYKITEAGVSRLAQEGFRTTPSEKKIPGMNENTALNILRELGNRRPIITDRILRLARNNSWPDYKNTLNAMVVGGLITQTEGYTSITDSGIAYLAERRQGKGREA